MATAGFEALRGAGVLAFWNDIPEDLEDEFNDWYTHQHLPERVGIEGFLRGRRFRRTSVDEDAPTYFTLYETESTATLTSAPYIDRLDHPTDWTKQITPRFLNVVRTACAVTSSVGQGTGGLATTVQFGPTAERESDLRAWVSADVLPQLVQNADVVAAHLLEADPEVTAAKDATAEQAAMSPQRSAPVRWFVLVESMTEEGARAARQALAEQSLVQHGAEPEIRSSTFRLLAALDH